MVRHRFFDRMRLYSSSRPLLDRPTAHFNEVQTLSKFIRSCSHLLCITGAGVSTLSGIPDYRGPQGSYSKGHKPLTHSEFMNCAHNRRRYWMRSWLGWGKISQSLPNDCHRALQLLEKRELLQHIVTQNVDMLHQKAGSQLVTNLHGSIDTVKCMNCVGNMYFGRR